MAFGFALALCGCAGQNTAEPRLTPPAKVLAVAPVLNLSGREDVDVLRITDLIASELQSFPGVQVVPVNRSLAELLKVGLTRVEMPADALGLAAATGADGTIVVAITEYDPYDPPVVGLVMQWYVADGRGLQRTSDDAQPADDNAVAAAPYLQVQRVFNASEDGVKSQLREYASARDEHRSPFGWRRYAQSQELYVRYCGWALFRTMYLLDAGGLEPAPLQRDPS